MKNLWAPWRVDYILSPKAGECVFCLGSPAEDEERQVLYRGDECFVIMNKYPYSNGHLMVAPYDHVGELADLREKTLTELILLVRRSSSVLKKHFLSQGMNIGMNIGEAAGAGVSDHLHCHLVPRWIGDSNFMAVLADVRAISQHLRETYLALHPYFKE
ncbi:MAG: HIT domain-containing protein [Desulfovibrionaceae bacterium]|nr:HIT domain-containing protein [Desulfovibrionaceae bacterium]